MPGLPSRGRRPVRGVGGRGRGQEPEAGSSRRRPVSTPAFAAAAPLPPLPPRCLHPRPRPRPPPSAHARAPTRGGSHPQATAPVRPQSPTPKQEGPPPWGKAARATSRLDGSAEEAGPACPTPGLDSHAPTRGQPVRKPSTGPCCWPHDSSDVIWPPGPLPPRVPVLRGQPGPHAESPRTQEGNVPRLGLEPRQAGPAGTGDPRLPQLCSGRTCWGRSCGVWGPPGPARPPEPQTGTVAVTLSPAPHPS